MERNRERQRPEMDGHQDPHNEHSIADRWRQADSVKTIARRELS
jgi:hypothetical protein